MVNSIMSVINNGNASLCIPDLVVSFVPAV